MKEGSKKLRQLLVLAVLAACLLILAVGGFLLSGPRQVVDWSAIRAVVIESDDWGLPGFAPSLAAWEGVDRQELNPGNFPEIYWGSTLEDSQMVADLCAILAGHQGQDGLPAVFQPNYVTGSWSWLPGPGEGHWQEFSFPEFPEHYQRPGLLEAVNSGINAGLWYPELHARWHYDPSLRLEGALSTALAREVTSRGVMLFPGSEKARELGSWRPLGELDQELRQSQAIFEAAFGRSTGSIIAPDYTWNTRMEDLWSRHELNVIQAKREQRDPDLGSGKVARLKKYLLRQWALRRYPERKYLERNCRLEPVQSPDPAAVVSACAAATRSAWRRGEPAVVESHRVNFAHLDPSVVTEGQAALDSYLTEVTQDPSRLPLFLTDVEIAQLQTRGTSWVRRGSILILRNGTRSCRVVPVPAGSYPGQDPELPTDQKVFLVKVPASQTVVVRSDGMTTSCPFER